MTARQPRTTVHFVRHGEVHNPTDVLYGRLPGFRLSDLGVEMAKSAAASLAGRDVVVLRSSPLERAQQTAEPFAAELGLPVETDDRLIESANAFEGRSLPGVSWREPRTWRYVVNPFRPSWGEPYAEVAARMLAAAEDARDAARGHDAVCISHQLPIWVLRRYVERRRLWHRPDRRQCGLASVTSFTWYGDRLATVTYEEPAGAASRKPATPGA
ncbi:MAG: histidine phosphatase family protein [Mycobacteriales bacterium]|nr:histidine phosphatase family protein [Frankia sp.]